ncbi:MAG: hypothetical protein ABGZ35_25635 [Planctomycetaceae bacterium]
MKTILMMSMLLLVDDDLSMRIQTALKQPLNEHEDFIPPLGSWQKLKQDRWATALTAAWLCDVTKEKEFREIWDLSEHTLVFERAISQVTMQRFEPFPDDGNPYVDVSYRPPNGPVENVVEGIRRKRQRAAHDPVACTNWEWGHARLLQRWRKKLQPVKPGKNEEWMVALDTKYGKYAPEQYSLRLNERFAALHAEWWQESLQRRRLDYRKTRRMFHTGMDWASTLPNRATACKNVKGLLDRIFDESMRRGTPEAERRDVLPILNDLDTFLLKAFPNITQDQVQNSVANMIAFLEREPSAAQLLRSLKSIRLYHERLTAIKEAG